MTKVTVEFEWNGEVVPKKWKIECGHYFAHQIAADDMTDVPPQVQVGGSDGIVDRRCIWCGTVHRAWGDMWEKYDKENPPPSDDR